MNRRDAIAASFGLIFAGTLPNACPRRTSMVSSDAVRLSRDFDPFMVWRESARFDRDVVAPMQTRLAMAMCEHIDRQWGVIR